MGAVSEPRDPGPASTPADDPRAVFAISPFTRLARTHALSSLGDALFALGLVGTVFFGLDPDEARWKVGLTLLLTLAPFAIAGPLIAPTLDRIRGGRRWMIVATHLGRAGMCALLVRDLDTIWFYPEAFLMLVLGKSYQIAKSAVVPTTVRNDAELVQANSKLSLIGALSAAAAALPGGLMLWLTDDPRWSVGAAGIVFAVGAAFATRVPSTAVAEDPADEAEKEELRGAGILLAASAMAVVRAIVGFLALLLAFNTKDDSLALGVILATAQIGYVGGAALAPRLRRVTTEESILIGVLATVTVASIGAALTGGLAAASVMSLTIGTAASAGKQAFDAIVQRDAPDANRGRSFGRFETRFQLFWVLGAVIPVLYLMPARLGFLVIAGAAAFAGTSYWMGLRSTSVRLSSLVRRRRRRARARTDEDVARELGFEHGMVAEGTEISLDESDTGSSSAAARRAARRRRVQPPPADDAVQQELQPSEGPDLDWNPRS